METSGDTVQCAELYSAVKQLHNKRKRIWLWANRIMWVILLACVTVEAWLIHSLHPGVLRVFIVLGMPGLLLLGLAIKVIVDYNRDRRHKKQMVAGTANHKVSEALSKQNQLADKVLAGQVTGNEINSLLQTDRHTIAVKTPSGETIPVKLQRIGFNLHFYTGELTIIPSQLLGLLYLVLGVWCVTSDVMFYTGKLATELIISLAILNLLLTEIWRREGVFYILLEEKLKHFSKETS